MHPCQIFSALSSGRVFEQARCVSSAAPIVGRLAPSPTGHLHLGHARSFLLAWWHARSRGGEIILRFEDIDVARASQAHIDSAQRDLEWLGLDWDGPTRIQSERLEELRSAAETLLSKGLAYPCVCTRADLRAAAERGLAQQSSAHRHSAWDSAERIVIEPLGAPQQGSKEARYPGTCRGRFSNVEDAERSSHRDAGLRFIAPDRDICFDDLLWGPQRFNVAEDVGDFLILRRNKTPAYQLTVVLDDAMDGVTEVVRGDDLLPSTARQILVRQALGLPEVSHAHVPLVCDPIGRRLAKREQDLSLLELRERGCDPRGIVAWAARSSGQAAELRSDARLTAGELIGDFDIMRVPRSPVLLSERWAPS